MYLVCNNYKIMFWVFMFFCMVMVWDVVLMGGVYVLEDIFLEVFFVDRF